MIIVRLISGLGNQLFQYAIGRQLSLKNKTELKLDISSFETQNLRSFKLDHFNINAEVATEDEVENLIGLYQRKNILAKFQRKYDQFLPKYKRHLFKEQEWWTYEPEIWRISPNTYLDGYWQHYKYFDALPHNLKGELALKEPRELEQYPVFSAIEKDVFSVSVHIRRGDYISDQTANQFMGVLPIHYYVNAIDILTSKISNPSLYVFSDDLNWAKDHVKTETPVTYVEVGNGQKDYLELYAMSQCRHNIIANSSFSWWGAFLNKNHNKIIIAPDKWVMSQEINRRINLCFPSWIKI